MAPPQTNRLRGKGLPTIRSSGRGDQLMHIFVETPTRLTGSQREMLESFKRPDFREGVTSFMEKRPPAFERLHSTKR